MFDPFAPPENLGDLFLINLFGSSPLLLVDLVLLVLAACFIRRHPKPAVLLIAATLLSMLLITTFPLIHHVVVERHWEFGGDPDVLDRRLRLLSVGSSLGHGISWLLAGLAVFAGRRGNVAGIGGLEPNPGAPSGARSGVEPSAPIAVRPISRGFYLGTIVGGFVASILLAAPGLVLIATARPRDEEQLMIGSALGCSSALPAILATVTLCVLIHRLWSALPRDCARTSPGLAVGLLFVPLFNLYWIFQVYVGWTTDFNRFARERDLDVRPLSTALPTVFCVFAILSIVPLLGYVFSLANLVLLPVFLGRAITAVNRVAMVADG